MTPKDAFGPNPRQQIRSPGGEFGVFTWLMASGDIAYLSRWKNPDVEPKAK
jgi:hypothetical protein